jgi:cytochrome c biogenesis factor
MEADQMTAGNILLYLTFLSTCLAAMYIFKGRIKQGILITRTATVLSTLCVLLLAYAFIFLDFSLIYVWQRNSAELSILYRLAAILTGQEGTYLVWAWLSLIVVLVYIELNNKQEPIVRLASVYALVGCAFLFALTIMMTPFKSIYIVSGASLPSSGSSISPALMDILMPVHIFSTFAAYALAIIPAAVSLAYLRLNEKKIAGVRNYLRLSWFFLSLCMFTGGLWANRLLGWNGFWQWDPIQSTALAIWLLLTTALHAVVRFNRGEYKQMFPLLCICTFLGCMYTTLVARSDIFGSIHSFPGTPTWWMLLGSMMIIIFYSLVQVKKPTYTAITGGLRAIFEPQNTFYFTILISIIMIFVSVWGPTMYVILIFTGSATILPPEYYYSFFYPMTVVLTYLIGVCMLYGRVSNTTLARVLVSYVIVSIILVIAVPHSIYVLSYLPASFFVICSIFFKSIKDLKVKNKRITLHLTGINMIHAGFIFVVMGSILSTSFATTHIFNYSLAEKGVYKENANVGVRLLDYNVEYVGTDWIQVLDVEVIDSSTYEMTSVFFKSRQFGFIARPAVKHGLLGDTQLDFQGSTCVPHIQTENIEFRIKKYPFLSLLWGGSILMVAGVLFTIGASLMHRMKKKL